MKYHHYSQLQPMTAAILDTETTGTGNDAEACEIALIAMDGLETYPLRPFFANNFDEYEQRFMFTAGMNPHAEAVHGINKTHVVGCDHNKEFMLPEVGYLLCHNAPFDTKILQNCHPKHAELFAAGKIKSICTLAISRKLFRKGTDVSGHKLTTLITELIPNGADLITEAHGALADCRLTLILLGLILERLPRVTSWEDLYQYQNEGKEVKSPKKAAASLLDVMPFGKHKGELFSDVPKSYLEWLLNQDLQPKLRRTCEHWVGK